MQHEFKDTSIEKQIGPPKFSKHKSVQKKVSCSEEAQKEIVPKTRRNTDDPNKSLLEHQKSKKQNAKENKCANNEPKADVETGWGGRNTSD